MSTEPDPRRCHRTGLERSAVPRTAATSWPGTRAGWSSSGTPFRANACWHRVTDGAERRQASGARTPSRCWRPPRPGGASVARRLTRCALPAHGRPPVGGAEFGPHRAGRAAPAEGRRASPSSCSGWPASTPTPAAPGASRAGEGARRRRRAWLAHPDRPSRGPRPDGWRMHAHRSDDSSRSARCRWPWTPSTTFASGTVDLPGVDRVEVAAPANGSAAGAAGPRPGTRPAGWSRRPSAVQPPRTAGLRRRSGSRSTGELTQAARTQPGCWKAAAGHEFRVTGDGFWQIHRQAPANLVRR